MEIPGLITYFNWRTDSNCGANSNSGVNSDSFSGVNCDSLVDSDSGADSDSEADFDSRHDFDPDSAQESASESAPESIPACELIANTESESGRSDSDFPPLVVNNVTYVWDELHVQI